MIGPRRVVPDGEVDVASLWTQNVHMKTATVRDLRNNFSVIETWLGEGEEVRIEKRGEPIAIIKALPKRRGAAVKKPDFAARQKAIWGDRVFSEKEVREMREYELKGEQG